jgi:hypothetical protein
MERDKLRREFQELGHKMMIISWASCFAFSGVSVTLGYGFLAIARFVQGSLSSDLFPLFVALFQATALACITLLVLAVSLKLLSHGIGSLLIFVFGKVEILTVQKYSHPRENHPKMVGITICNRDSARDFSDISIKLTKITQYEHQQGQQEHKSTRIIDMSTNEFELGDECVIKAMDDKKSFFLVEIEQTDLVFMTRERHSFGKYYSHPMIVQPDYKMYEVVIEFEFEIHGNLGNDKVGETYTTKINSTRFIPTEKINGDYDSKYDTVTLEMGDVFHVKEKKHTKVP